MYVNHGGIHCAQLSLSEKFPRGRCKSKMAKKQQNQGCLNYWQRYWAEKGTKMTGRDHKILISKFPGRPCGFKVAKDKKHQKIC